MNKLVSAPLLMLLLVLLAACVPNTQIQTQPLIESASPTVSFTIAEPSLTPVNTATVTPTATAPIRTNTPSSVVTPKSTATNTRTSVTATRIPATAALVPRDGSPANPWGYNFTCCQFIYSPPSNFCSYFKCIDSFWKGAGYVVQCNDGMYSKSGGRKGFCSSHTGNGRALYTP